MKILIFGLILFCLNISPLLAEENSAKEILNEANTFFTEANKLNESDKAKKDELYRKSLLRYEQLTRENKIQNSAIYYNIANIYFLLGDLGHSVLNYKRAQMFDASDENIQNNLDFVRKKCQDKFEKKNSDSALKTVLFLHYTLNKITKQKVAILLFALFWILLIINQFTRHYVSRSLISITLLLSALFYLSAYLHDTVEAAVITQNEVTARKGDGLNYEPAFSAPLHAGCEVNILESRDDWYRVELQNGLECWLPQESLEKV